MKKCMPVIALLLPFLFVLSGCVTINIYFPAAAVEKAADKIVEEVWGADEGKPESPETEGSPQGLLHQGVRFVFSVIGPREAFAQEADINVTTPAIRALKEAIKQRADLIKPYLDSGNAGLGNDGLLVIRSKDGLNLKDQASIARLINAENADRETLYQEIARANNFSVDKVAEIKSIFARSWIRQARNGWWVQGPEGSWNRK